MQEQVQNTIENKNDQLKTIFNIVNDPLFGKSVINDVYPYYYKDKDCSRIVTIIKDYFAKYQKIPNFDNIEEIATDKYQKEIDIEAIKGIIKKMRDYREAINKKQIEDDSDYKKDRFKLFLKTQECTNIISKLSDIFKTGDHDKIKQIPVLFEKAVSIGETTELCEDIFDDIDGALSDDYRDPISTGIEGLDELMEGGLGNGEIAILMMANGVGKTTLLTMLANACQMQGKNVLQVFFEDNEKQIKRKHYAKYLKCRLSDLKTYDKAIAKQKLEAIKEKGLGHLKIIKFKKGRTTIASLKAWIEEYQKFNNIKFDMLVIDYLDCVYHTHKVNSVWDEQLFVVKDLERMVTEMNIPVWTAVQAKKDAGDKDLLYFDDMGGSVERSRKAHFFITIGKNVHQRNTSKASMVYLKSRITRDGFTFPDIEFDNDRLYLDVPVRSGKSFKISDLDANNL